jgi:hypothetical protein
MASRDRHWYPSYCHRKRVRIFSIVELVKALEQEKAEGKVGKIAQMLVKTDLLVLPSRASTHALLGNRRVGIFAVQHLGRRHVSSGKQSSRLFSDPPPFTLSVNFMNAPASSSPLA